jgi:hypothetical protein
VLHEAAIGTDGVRWDTRVYDCGAPRADPRHVTSVLPIERAGTTVHFRPPPVQEAPVEVVIFEDPNLVFAPIEAMSPHRTRHGIEVFRPDHASRDELMRCLRDQGVHLPPAALLLGMTGQNAAPLLEGRFIPRQEAAHAVLGVSAVLLVAILVGLAVAWRRLARRARVEAAEAILRADLPGL